MAVKLTGLPVSFWRAASGREPVRQWISALSKEDKRIVGRDIAKVQFGWPVGLPLCRPMGNGLWEVRSTVSGHREARVLFGFHDGAVVLLSAFFKTTRATPATELELARSRLKQVAP